MRGSGLVLLHRPICVVSVIGACVSIDFTFTKFNSCHWSKGPVATAYWLCRRWSAKEQWRMGHCRIDCANEVAYLLPVSLPCPPGMLRPDRLKASAWDHSLGVVALLGWRGQGALCVGVCVGLLFSRPVIMPILAYSPERLNTLTVKT